MLQFIMDQNLLLYVCGAACAFGVVSQFLLKYLYERLISETQIVGEPKGKFLRQIKQRFKNCRHLNEKVNDMTAFIDRSILDYHFLKMDLHQWQRIGKEAFAICLLSCGLGIWLLHHSGVLISFQTSYCKAAVLSAVLISLAYGMNDNNYRQRSLKIRLIDYLQNSGVIKEYSEVDFQEGEILGIQEAAVETASASAVNTTVNIGRKLRRSSKGMAENRAQKEKRELKESLAREKLGMNEIAVSQEEISEKEKNRNVLRQMDTKEKEQILREVLLEILS